jgi:opacity protein-like surface antigen
VKGGIDARFGSLGGPRFQRVRTAHCAAPLVHDASANFADNFVIDWSRKTGDRNLIQCAAFGAAVTSDRYEDITTASGAVLGSVSQTRWGGTAGAGVEYGFTPNWTAAFEYDRLFMGGKNVTYIGPAGIAFANKQLTRDVDLFTVRVNYKFGGSEVARF